jgi:hypothetical protein
MWCIRAASCWSGWTAMPEPEWAVVLLPQMGNGGLDRVARPLRLGDGWLEGLELDELDRTLDEHGRAVFLDPKDALQLLQWLVQTRIGETFYLVPWWERLERARQRAMFEETERAEREHRRAGEDAVDRDGAVALDEGRRRPPEWMRSRER